MRNSCVRSIASMSWMRSAALDPSRVSKSASAPSLAPPPSPPSRRRCSMIGLIMPRQDGAVRDAARGRPRVLLELNPDAARVVGVKITPHRIVHVVTDFQGDVLAELTQPVRVDRQPAEVIADLVEDGVRRCVADAGLALEQIESLCVALPGVVEYATGLVRRSPDPARRRRPLRKCPVRAIGPLDPHRERRQRHHDRRALVPPLPRPRRFRGGDG